MGAVSKIIRKDPLETANYDVQLFPGKNRGVFYSSIRRDRGQSNEEVFSSIYWDM